MSRVLPYPLLTAALVLMWMLLNSFSLGQLLLGTAIAVAASRAMTPLEPSKPRLRGWRAMPKLAAIVTLDILLSNLAVAAIVLRGGRRRRWRVGIRLEERNPDVVALVEDNADRHADGDIVGWLVRREFPWPEAICSISSHSSFYRLRYW